MPHKAFRCRACGHLEHAAHAGECAVPRACSGCGAGVVFDPKGNKTHQPENWEVLADAKPERIAELGLEPEHVARHTPVTREASHAEDTERVNANLAVLIVKERAWQANREAIFAEHDKLKAKLETLVNLEDQNVMEEHQHTKHLMRELVNLEFTPRDEAHKKVLEDRIKNVDPPRSTRHPQHHFASGYEFIGPRTGSVAKVT